MLDRMPLLETEFESQVIRLADLAVTNLAIDGLAFHNCQLIGPVVLCLMENIELAYCEFRGATPSTLVQEVPEVAGHIELKAGWIPTANTVFRGCSFERVTFAGVREITDAILNSEG